MKRNLFSGLLTVAMLLALAPCGLRGTAPDPGSAPIETPMATAENSPAPEETAPVEDAPHQAGKVLAVWVNSLGLDLTAE